MGPTVAPISKAPRRRLPSRVCALRATVRSCMACMPGSPVRLFSGRQQSEERLIWSRDVRFIHTLAARVPSGRQIELEAGSCLIGPGHELTDALTAEVARESHGAEFGLVSVDQSLPIAYRYVVALSSAVQVSGLADR